MSPLWQNCNGILCFSAEPFSEWCDTKFRIARSTDLEFLRNEENVPVYVSQSTADYIRQEMRSYRVKKEELGHILLPQNVVKIGMNDDFRNDENERKKLSTVCMSSLTPAKIGMKAYEENEDVVEWFQNQENLIESVKTTSSEADAIRMITMALPMSYRWICPYLSDVKNLEEYKRKVIELMLGPNGCFSKFMGAKMNANDHPMRYFYKLTSYLKYTGKIHEKDIIEALKLKILMELDTQNEQLAIEARRRLLCDQSINTIDQISKELQLSIDLVCSVQKQPMREDF